MVEKGSFGFIIGRKNRFMQVEDDADILWRILVREMYVIMKHYNFTKERVQEAFEKIKVCKGTPKKTDIKKCRKFANMENESYESYESYETNEGNEGNEFNKMNEWTNLLRFCQCSFINLLESGYILLKDEDTNKDDYKFEFDFNKWEARFYEKNVLIERATIEEIMGFQEMPLKSYATIVSEMDERFNDYHDKLLQVESELEKLYRLKVEARNQGAANIEEKVDKLIDDMKWELKELNMNRRVFYNRLKDLDLISIHF